MGTTAHCPMPVAPDVGERPAPDKIEVTDAMIRAGVEANMLFTTDPQLEERAVIEIYRAMRRACPKGTDGPIDP